MGYRYNPNDQQFYDQLAQMSGIERRSTLDDRARNAERLKTEQAFLQAMKNLPDDYQKGFVNKRARTKLKYGEEGALEDLNTSDATTDKTLHNFGESEIAPMEISAPAPVESAAPSQRFGNPSPTSSTMGRNYSPGAVDVLEGRADAGWNPPMSNPPPRPAPGSWMNETPYPAPMTNRQPVPFPPFPLTEEEVALAEIEKKKEPTQAEVTTANSLAPPTSEETAVKPKKDPRVSFRRFKADEFLKNNAVFQMDLPRIQPTYATMLNAEISREKTGNAPGARKDWEILKDFDSEEGAAAFNPYKGIMKTIPGLKRYEKPEKPGSIRPVEIADENNQPTWVKPEDAIGKKRPNPTVMVPGYDAQGNQVTIPVPKYPKPGQGNIPKQPGVKPRPKPPRLPDGLDIGVMGEGEPAPSEPTDTNDDGAFVPPERSLLDKLMLSGTAYADEGNKAQLLGGRQRSPIIPVAASPDAPAKGLDTSKIKFGTPYLRRDATREGPQGKPTELPPVKTFDLNGNPIEMKRRVYENGEEEVEFYPVKEREPVGKSRNVQTKRKSIESLKSTLNALNRIEKNYDDFTKKGHESGALPTKIRGYAGDINAKWAGVQKLIEDDEKEISLNDFVEAAKGMVSAMNTQKEAERFNKSTLNIREIAPETYEVRLKQKKQQTEDMIKALTRELEKEDPDFVNEGSGETAAPLSAAERARKILEGKK
jgi:hypothetical protein